ncbi:hypothetical protein [uncultured Anaerococcus sp.]|uniref:hypothetical protein n=1 Tax=uncultured Anaerococcus sp. TaxID=293428 RepID=UPI00262694A6|nr:hypothetical protein [uncultured Anaerococcus sp.]
MIKTLERELIQEIQAKEEAMKPYNKRIKNLKQAINNLKQFDITADEMNSKEQKEATKTKKL